MKIEELKKDLKLAFGEMDFLDYAVVDTDEFGDCNTCVNEELSDRYGLKSHGIYLKVWEHGMNRINKNQELDTVYIAHDVNKKEYKKIIEILYKYFVDVRPKEYNPEKAIELVLE